MEDYEPIINKQAQDYAQANYVAPKSKQYYDTGRLYDSGLLYDNWS